MANEPIGQTQRSDVRVGVDRALGGCLGCVLVLVLIASVGLALAAWLPEVIRGDHEAAAAAAVVAAAERSAGAPRATNITVATHAARFNDGELSTCVTFEVSAREVTAESATVVGRFLGGARARMTPERTRSGRAAREGVTRLEDDQSCESQFADRTVFGTCTIAIPMDDMFEPQANLADDDPLPNDVRAEARPYAAQFSMRFIERHYSLDVVESDREMQTCMEGLGELRGEWEALSRDSREVRRARLDRSQRDLRRVLNDPLGRRPGPRAR